MGAGTYFRLTSVVKRVGLGFLGATVRGFAQRGFQDSNVSKEMEISKQLDDFLKLQTPRCEKPLLAAALSPINLVFIGFVCICFKVFNFT